MIIGLDVHGVIDTDPKFFAKLTKSLQFKGYLSYIQYLIYNNATR